MNITKLALQRPVLIFVLMLVAIVFGYSSFQAMRKEKNPEVNFGTINITTLYPGAGPDDINQLISRKVEEAVGGVNGIREVTATSQEGVSTVTITLELGVNTDIALNDIRTKVDSITNDLPKDSRKPTIAKYDNTAQPILTLAVNSATLSAERLRDLVDDRVKDRFAQVQDVAAVTVQGGDIREIQVQISKQKLLQYGIGIGEVLTSIQGAAINTPSGKYISGDREYTVRVKSDFTKLSDAKRVVINIPDPNNPQGKSQQVKLTDIATVKDTIKERTTQTRLNAKDAVILQVQKTKEGNAIQITEAINQVIPLVEKEFGITITKTFQDATSIKDSLDDVTFALVFGIILVGAIVYIFLHDFRGTLIVSLAIPTSIFAAFIGMKLVGFTINNLSMIALSLAIGVLVDDAIVVLENIFRHLKMGEDPGEAAINGRNEIGVAALAITLADVVVFLPIGFAGGITGQFFKPLAFTYVFAVLFSLFVSFTLTPLLAARWYRKGEDVEKPKGRFAIWFEKNFAKLEHAYRGGLEWALQHRWGVFVGGNVLLVAVFVFIIGSFAGIGKASPFSAISVGMTPLIVSVVIGIICFVANLIFQKRVNVWPVIGGVVFGLLFPIAAVGGSAYQHWKSDSVFKFSFIPKTDALQVKAAIELPVGSSLAETDRVTKIIEKSFVAHPAVKFVVSNVGRQTGSSLTGETNSSNFSEVIGTMYTKASTLDNILQNGKKEKLRNQTGAGVQADLTAAIGQIPGASVRVSTQDDFNFGSAIQVSLTSDDRALLEKTAQTIRDRLAGGAVPGVINPEVSSKSGKPEIRIIPDYRKAADLGVDASTIGTAMRTLYQGNDDIKLRVAGREYGVRLMMNREDRDDPATLATIPIKYKQGNPIYLSSVANVQATPGLSKITRRNRIEEIIVNADLLPGYENGTVNANLRDFIKKENLVPTGVNYKPLGQADSQARESGFLVTAFLTGILLVYLVLAALYNNWLYPLIIQVAQPQAIVGALLALILTDKAFSVIGFIGLVALIGLVGKNAILLVDYTNSLRERGRSRHDAILESGPTRLRPIIMTTMALILGTLPVALAIGRGAEFRETIGIIVIGGISLSTILTLFVIPCSYTIFDDISNVIAKATHKPMSFGGPDGFAQTNNPVAEEAGIEAASKA